MAGGNKSHSPKVMKRKLQDQIKAQREAEEKKKRFSRWTPRTNGSPGGAPGRSSEGDSWSSS
jgi:hypothetical protein